MACGLPSWAPAALAFAVRSGGTPRARSVHAPSLCNAAPQSPLLNPQAKKDASRFRALVLIISVAAAFSAGFNPYVTKPRVASKLAETEHADVCPPHWLPVLLAARPSHIDSPAPRFDDEALPFEEDVNAYVTDELAFEFHYFFTRKLWFMYLAKALVVFPGGFGTLDELMELLTLVQTKKISKPLPIVLFGKEYWNSVINFKAMVEWGTISAKDLDLFLFTDDVDEAVDYMTKKLVEAEGK